MKMKKRLSMVFAAGLAAAVTLGSFPVKVNAQQLDRDRDFDHFERHRLRWECRHCHPGRSIATRMSKHRPGHKP
jgi:hypothetical protein